MVKIHKMFCIDSDLGERLRGINGSELINGLLSEHFGAEISEDINLIKKKIKELGQNKAVLCKKIRFFKEKASKIQLILEEERMKTMTNQQKEKRKALAESLMEAWREDEISEDEYWKGIDNLDGK